MGSPILRQALPATLASSDACRLSGGFLSGWVSGLRRGKICQMRQPSPAPVPQLGDPLKMTHWLKETEDLRAARMELAQSGHAHHCFPPIFSPNASSGCKPNEELSPSWVVGHNHQCGLDAGRTESCVMPLLEAGLSSLPVSTLRTSCEVLILTQSSSLAACSQQAEWEPPPSWLKRQQVDEGGERLGLEGREQTLHTGGLIECSQGQVS